MSDPAIRFARALIARPSVTPDDAGCMEFVVDQLKPMGFEATWLDFADTRNLWLKRGTSSPTLVFLGHTDVVPPGPLEDWASHPFEPQVRDSYLYGRGSADMKSSIAAFMAACQRFVPDNPSHTGSIALLLTSDEEGCAANGIVKAIEALKKRGQSITWCLVGEPTSTATLGDVVKVGRRGSLCGILRVKGTQGHVAYPHLADNPIHRLAPALHELVNEVWDRGNEFFPPTSFQISNIKSGTGAENVIPGSLEVWFNFRFSPEIEPDEMKQRLQAILDRNQLDYQIDWRLSGNPFLTRQGELIGAVQTAIQKVLKKAAELSTSGGTSDGRFVAPTGAQVVELGPLNKTIHKVNECIRLEDIPRLALVYEQILLELLTNGWEERHARP